MERTTGPQKPSQANGTAMPPDAPSPGQATPPFSISPTERYLSWQKTPAGQFALNRKRYLVRQLIEGWPRRTRSMLVMDAGPGDYLEDMWDAGFDVSGQERSPELCGQARARLGTRAELTLASPDLLPYEDCSFDYALAVDCLEFWQNPAEALGEMRRVACAGLILTFPNRWSLFGLRCRASSRRGGYGSARPWLRTRAEIDKLIFYVIGPVKKQWLSVLVPPISTWRDYSLFRRVNSLGSTLPLGAVVGVRIDLGPLRTGTPMVVPARQAVSSPAE